MKTKIALQLWSIKDNCEKDFFSSLEEVSKMGYHGVEFAGYYDKSSKELRDKLDELNLQVVASHIPYEKIIEGTDEVIAYEKAIGNKNIVCPYATFDTLDQWREFFGKLKIAKEKINKAGLSLYYHNHAHELTQIEGVDILKEMIHEIPGIKLEVDTYWIDNAGKDVVTYLTDVKNNLGLVHIKDAKKEPNYESTEIGTGKLNVQEYIKVAIEANVSWIIAEQEAFDKYKPIESAKINAENLLKFIGEVK